MGRVEYAQLGGQIVNHLQTAKINADFIDNSGGVSCSDREVNIKIALQVALHKKKINLEQRNEILKSMETEVCELVLKDNLLQNIALMIEEYSGCKALEWHHFLIKKLEKLKILSRDFEFLPADAQIDKMKDSNKCFSRPEIAILLSYSKIWLKHEIIHTNLPDNKYFEKFLIGYFPQQMQQDFKDEILMHPLKREIITNYIVNTLVNRIGINFMLNIMEKSGTSITDIVYAYIIVRDGYNLRRIWHDVEYNHKFKTIMPKINSLSEIKKYTEYIVCRFLRTPGYDFTDLKKNIEDLKEKVGYCIENFEKLTTKKNLTILKQKTMKYSGYGFNKNFSEVLAKISALMFIPSISYIYKKKGVDFNLLVELYFIIEEKLYSREIRRRISKWNISEIFQEISLAILIDDIAHEHNKIIDFIINEYYSDNKHEKLNVSELAAKWLKAHDNLVANYLKLAKKIANSVSGDTDYTIIILLLNRMKLLH